MIEVFVPFLLIMMSWDPAVGEASIDVNLRKFLSIEECEKAGRDIERLRNEAGMPSQGFAWRCVAAPERIEKHSGEPEQ